MDARCHGVIMSKVKFAKTSVNTYCSVEERLFGCIYRTCEAPALLTPVRKMQRRSAKKNIAGAYSNTSGARPES